MNPIKRFFLLFLALSVVGCGHEESAPPDHPPESRRPKPTSEPPVEPLPVPSKASAPFQIFIQKLWKTPFGSEFHSFLFDAFAGEKFMTRLDHLTDRLFDDPQTALRRISILQLLSEDLYQAGLLNDDAEKRLRLLEGRVSLQRLKKAESPFEMVVLHGAVILVASMPFGSPLFREALRNSFGSVGARLMTLFGRQADHTAPVETISIRRLFSSDFTKDYELRTAMAVFLNVFGADSFAYLTWYEFKYTPSGELVERELRSFDFERLLREAAEY
jgi:hypothetical protein